MPKYYISIVFFLLVVTSLHAQRSGLYIKYTIDGEDKELQLYWQQEKYNGKDFSIRANYQKNKKYQLNIIPKKNLTLQHVELKSSLDHHADVAYFCNGFQSWTTTEERKEGDKERYFWPLLKAYGQQVGDYKHYYQYPRKKNIFHSWSYTYKRKGDAYQFIGSLNEDKGFTNFIFNLREDEQSIVKDCQGRTIAAKDTFSLFDLVFLQGDYQTVWQGYRDCFPENPSSAKPAIGWTSWYNYYDKIDQEIILENLNNYAKEGIPLDLFQIDDGYQAAVGDWMTVNKKFPKGMKYLADQIHQKGYQAGIWLAPFIAHKKSKVFKEHPDWFIQNKKGQPLRIAKNVIWGGAYYALDIYNPKVEAHLQKVLSRLLYDWGYDMIKVDFLFAVCLRPPPHKTRGEVMADAMRLLRKYAQNRLILGCGVPLAPSFQQVDYCRVGNDAHLGWEFGVLKWFGNAERPSTWSTLTNTIMRYPLSGKFFWNDPDVFILRDKKTRLNNKEKFSMLLLNNLLGALIFTSDNIGNYDYEQKNLYKSIFPYTLPTEVEILPLEADYYQINFRVKERRYKVFTNLSNQSKQFTLDKYLYFYAPKQQLVSNTTITLNPHESKLFYQVDTTKAIDLLGGQNHLISGQEVQTIEYEGPNKVSLTFKQNALDDRSVFFYVQDKTIQAIQVNGNKVAVDNQLAKMDN